MPDKVNYDLDIRPLDRQVSAIERETRVNLAAAFRAACHFGSNDTINNHITARIASIPATGGEVYSE